MERVRLDVLVAGERVRVGAVLEQDAGRLDMAEEAREPEWLEAVVPVGVGEGGVLGEELAQPVRLPEGCCFEDVQLRRLAEELFDPFFISAVEGFEEFCPSS